MRPGLKNLILDDDQTSGLDLLAKLGLTSGQTGLYVTVLPSGPIAARELASTLIRLWRKACTQVARRAERPLVIEETWFWRSLT
jgi:hypothetical protein